MIDLYKNLPAFLPEFMLAILSLSFLLILAFHNKAQNKFSSIFVSATLLFILFVEININHDVQSHFSGLFVSDYYTIFMKSLVIGGSLLTFLIAIGKASIEDEISNEYGLLILLSVLGMMVMISAGSMLSLYLGLELQSLCLYILAAIRRDYFKSTEAGIKYFILGSFASGMLLYGMSLIYGFAGTVEFNEIAALHASHGLNPSFGLILGFVFFLVGLAFKIGAVPFHMWIPDVYEGSPTPVTAFFSVAPKIAAVSVFLKILLVVFADLQNYWQQIIMFLSIASMIFGTFAALNQTNIKRLIAYSAIAHIGFILVGLVAGTEDGIKGVLLYMTIYLFMIVGVFSVILAMRREKIELIEIENFSGLSKTKPFLAAFMTVFMFSMAGIPPLAGFFAKLYVFLPAIESGFYFLVIIGALTTVVGAYYYLKIVKMMYFEDLAEEIDSPISNQIKSVLLLTGLFTLLFFLNPNPFLLSTAKAASILFSG